MVKYRPDPRGLNHEELFKWQSTLGPFRSIGFKYNYYKFFDHGLKWPMIMGPFFFVALFSAWYGYSVYSNYHVLGRERPHSYLTLERPFMYIQDATDRRRLRGEWDNNNYCWRDSPDCGKDFKPRYFS